MKIFENVDLRPFTTFGVRAEARFMGRFAAVHELREYLDSKVGRENEILVIGGGSNILLTGNYAGLVLRNEIHGIEAQKFDDERVLVSVGAGENWHRFVRWCISRGYGGVENLSLIPGSVGAGPMQNIGAYGVEIRETFYDLEACHIATGEMHTFSNIDCEFGYRESVFKRKLKGQYVIAKVRFLLSTRPSVKLEYGAITTELEKMGVGEPGLDDVSQAVMRIRRSKLPDPAYLGNAGSFFKNPVVSTELADEISRAYPDVVKYPAEAGMVKIPAGWLIEKAGWKGQRRGNCGVHAHQALVLVNYGGAGGTEIAALSEEIRADILKKFGVSLESEVNIL